MEKPSVKTSIRATQEQALLIDAAGYIRWNNWNNTITRVPAVGRSIPDLQPTYDEFASDLKRAAEAK
jgi:hypothetical protein